jgi:membrane associated rhomboid family serine protease
MILTAMFLHGGIWHLLGNMYFLAVFGDNVEDRLGRAEYVALYLLGGVGAGLAHIARMPASDVPMLGASGAISAVLGAYAVLFPHRKLYMNLVVVMRRVPALVYLALWLAFQFYYAMQDAPGVAWWAHIGGVAVGVVFAAIHRAGRAHRLLAAAKAA